MNPYRLHVRGGVFAAFARLCFVSCAVAAVASGRERLDRGVVAFPTGDGHVYVGWRLLADDPAGTGFDVYRRDTATAAAKKLNPQVGSSRVDLQACKLEYSIVSPK